MTRKKGKNSKPKKVNNKGKAPIISILKSPLKKSSSGSIKLKKRVRFNDKCIIHEIGNECRRGTWLYDSIWEEHKRQSSKIRQSSESSNSSTDDIKELFKVNLTLNDKDKSESENEESDQNDFYSDDDNKSSSDDGNDDNDDDDNDDDDDSDDFLIEFIDDHSP